MQRAPIAQITLVSILGLLFGFAVLSPLSAPAQTPAATVEDGSGNVVLQSFVEGQLLAPGAINNGSIPTSGSGVRLMWHPAKAAFRAGQVNGSQWDNTNIGERSVALGLDTKASAAASVAMGRKTTAKSKNAVAMGSGTTASGGSAVAMGKSATASGQSSFAMGPSTASKQGAVAMGKATASGERAFAMGKNPTASGAHSVAMGLGANASGTYAMAMGAKTVAGTNGSFSVGVCNNKNQSADNTLFVAGNGTSPGGNCDTRSDELVLDNSGNFTIKGVFNDDLGTFAGAFEASKNASDRSPSSHVSLVENTNTGSDADGLAVQVGASTPGANNNFLTFFDGGGGAVGRIEGDGSGGVSLNSGAADFAEELPVVDGAAVPKSTDLVGVRGGKVSLDTKRADRLMVVSSAPAVTGNTTPSTQSDDARRVAVAFIGQVPTRIRGEVDVGDLIVASGQDDGTARAVAPSGYRRAEHGPIAGQAWSAKSTEGIGEVTVAVGLGQSGVVAERLQEQQNEIAFLKAENEKIKERLVALEAKVSPDEPALASVAGPWSLAVLLVLGLGGLLGAGLLWHRRV